MSAWHNYSHNFGLQLKCCFHGVSGNVHVSYELPLRLSKNSTNPQFGEKKRKDQPMRNAIGVGVLEMGAQWITIAMMCSNSVSHVLFGGESHITCTYSHPRPGL